MNLGKARTDKALTNASLAYRNSLDGYIWQKLFPSAVVKEKSAKIYNYGKNSLRIVDTSKATYGRYNKSKLDVTSATHYYIEDRGLYADVYEEDYNQAEKPLDPELDTSEYLLDLLMLDAEKAALDVVTTAGSYASSNKVTLSGTDQWNDYTNSDPIGDINTAITAVFNATGMMPNTIAMNLNTARTLRYHPAIRNYFPGASQITAKMLEDAIGMIFGIENVAISKTKYINSNKGASTEALVDVMGKFCWIGYVAPTPRLKSLSFGRTYTYTSNIQTLKLGASEIGERVLTEEVRSMILQKWSYDQVVVNIDCGYLISACIA